MQVSRVVLCSLLGLAGCLSDPDEGGGTATFMSQPTVTSARTTAGFVTYSTPLRSWKIRFVSEDSCAAAALAEFEINLAAAIDLPPLANIPFRLQTAPSILPSALYTGTAPLLSGSITITSAAATRLEGTFSLMLMVDAMPQVVTGSFESPTCP